MRSLFLCAWISIALASASALFARHSASPGRTNQAAPATGEAPKSQLASILEAKVRAAWAALAKRDKDAYAEFLADEFHAVEADGEGERSKPRVLREVERNATTDYLLQLFQVQPLGPDYAFVTYESTVQFPAGSATRYRRTFIGELWSLRDGQWRMLRYQETPVR
jgi:uncharacterized protein (TIGR02246 family)